VPSILRLPIWFSHHPGLLILAITLLAASIATLLVLIDRILVAVGMARRFWRTAAALTVGLGVWSALYIGLLSMRLPLPFSLNLSYQLGALALAVLAVYCGVMALDLIHTRPWVRGMIFLLTGLAAVATHWLMFSSVEMPANIRYRAVSFSTWLVLVAGATIAGLWLLDRRLRLRRDLAPTMRILFSVAMGSAGIALQQAGMGIAELVPTPARPVSVIDQGYMAAIPVGLTVFGILGLAAITVSNERRIEVFITSLTDRSPDALFVFSRTHILTYVNPIAERLVGQTKAALVGRPVWEAVPEALSAILREPAERSATENDLACFEFCYPVSGAWYEVYVQPWPDSVAVVLKDVSVRKSLEEQVRHQSLHDPLTGLANRTLFRDRVEQAVLDPSRREFAVLFIDLDDFKLINDSYGHQVGDEVLSTLGARLLDCVRTGDTVSRLGGDEFAIMLRSVSLAEATEVAERIIEAFGEPVRAGGRDVTVSPSIGIAMGEADRADNADELLSNADMAMYDAKARGKAQVRIYDPEMYRAVRSRLDLSTELRRAVQAGEMVLHYQPVVALDTGHVLYLEALVRWDHPERGVIPPSEFIPLAEETGLIVPIGKWVVNEACRQTRLWQKEFPTAATLAVGVNLSAGELEEPALAATVKGALAASGLAPAHLVLEVTESSLLGHTTTVLHHLESLRSHGVSLAIDDFGTGYSSLAYLRRFPFSIIKLDKTFVAESTASDRDKALLGGVLDLARGLNVEVVAEGVERHDQARMLQELGCPFGQGYCFTRPLPPGPMADLLRKGMRTVT